MSTYARKTCAICGVENVPHTKSGEPLWIHTRDERHMVAERRRAARRVLISGLRAAVDRGHVQASYVRDLEERCAAYFGTDWPAPGSGLEKTDAGVAGGVETAGDVS